MMVRANIEVTLNMCENGHGATVEGMQKNINTLNMAASRGPELAVNLGSTRTILEELQRQNAGRSSPRK